MPPNPSAGHRHADRHETIFAAARDAVGEEPIAAGGVHDLRTPLGSQPASREPNNKLFTAARDAVGEEPIGMGGW